MTHVASESGRRRAEIFAFLKGLSAREKLVILAYLGAETGIAARMPCKDGSGDAALQLQAGAEALRAPPDRPVGPN
jgi:hypothetical protein